MVFKFQVNRMKFEDCRKFGLNWPIGLYRPFRSTEFYKTSMPDRRSIGDVNLRKFQNDWLSGLCWRRADGETKNEKSLRERHLAKLHKAEWHSVERIPLPGGTVHVLDPTDVLDPKQNILAYFDLLANVQSKGV